jgi:hypothetical protein
MPSKFIALKKDGARFIPYWDKYVCIEPTFKLDSVSVIRW